MIFAVFLMQNSRIVTGTGAPDPMCFHFFSKRKKFLGKKVIPQGLQTINSSIKTICRHVNI
jgi:hypothetical protein